MKVVYRSRHQLVGLPKNRIVCVADTVECGLCLDYPNTQKYTNVDKQYVYQFAFENFKGKKLIKETFDKASTFDHGQGEVWRAKERYLINKKGEKAFEEGNVANASGYRAGVKVVVHNNKRALVDSFGKRISPWVDYINLAEKDVYPEPYFENYSTHHFDGFKIEVPEINHGTVVFKNDGLFGLMDTTGQIIVPAKYHTMFWEAGHHYRVSLGTGINERFGIIDRNGKTTIPAEFYKIDYYYEVKAFILYKEKDSKPVPYQDF